MDFGLALVMAHVAIVMGEDAKDDFAQLTGYNVTVADADSETPGTLARDVQLFVAFNVLFFEMYYYRALSKRTVPLLRETSTA